MALFYQSGRVSRLGVGVPGFSQSGDLTLDVAGSIGIASTQPRSDIDTPNISIRGDIFDSAGDNGTNGAFLSQDAVGVRWRVGNPEALAVINVQENGVQVGIGSFDTLNFIGGDPFVVEVEQGSGGAALADIKINPAFLKRQFGSNFAISTGFGPDGTYGSIPGFGTDTAAGVTSVGIGTNQPQDDFQVGVGSTGVTINGPTGTVRAVRIEADELEIDGNITVESLVVDPGIATFRGNIDAQGISSFKNDLLAVKIDTDLLLAEQIVNDNLYSGLSTLGVGGTDTFVLGDLFVQGGIGTFDGDVFIGGDLTVQGETFFNQINAVNIQITGIATINEFQSLVGQSTFFTAGIATVDQIGFNTGIGTFLDVDIIDAGIGTFQFIDVGIATVGFATIEQAFIGILTVLELDVEDIEAEGGNVGVLTVNDGLTNNGVSTFVGFATFGSDIFVSGFGTFGEGVDIPFVQVDDLVVSGIATIANLDGEVADIEQLFTENQQTSGVGSFGEIVSGDVQSGTGTIGGVGFGSGQLEADFIDADFGRIGILTGDVLDYNIGFITNLFSPTGTATFKSFRGEDLIIDSTTETSFINDVSFSPFGDLFVPGRLEVRNSLGQQIILGDISDPTVGLTTVTGDLYVGNDFYVGGTQFIDNLVTENISVNGIATVNQLELNTGIATFIDFETLQSGLGTITNLTGTIATFTRYNGSRLAISTDFEGKNPAEGEIIADGVSAQFLGASEQTQLLGSNFVNQLDVSGLTTFRNDVFVDNATLDVTGLTTTDNLFAGIATILLLDVEQIEADNMNTGVGTVGNLVVSGSADFEGDVVVDIGGTANIGEGNIGFGSIANLNTGVGTVGLLSATGANIGVATVGLVSATDIEVDNLDGASANLGVATIGFASIGPGGNNPALFVSGVTTLSGFTTTKGSVFIDGDLAISGVTTIPFVDTEQATIGIVTIRTLLDSNGTADFENVSISTTLSVTGVTTLSGFTTTSDVIVGGALTVVGDTTFIGVVSITDTLFVNQEVTGVSTVNNLEFNVGAGGTLDVGILTAGSLAVSGASTFTGVGTFQNDLYVAEDLFVKRNIEATGIAASTINVSGLSTLGNTVINGAVAVTSSVGIAKTLIVGGDVVIGGGITFEGNIDVNVDVDVNVQGNINVGGIGTIVNLDFGVGIGSTLTVEELNVTGLSSLTDVTAGVATIGFASITDANVGVLTAGISSVGFLTVGTGSTTDGSFFRTGVGTIVGFTTITGDLFLDGDLELTGSQIIPQLDADQARIGILTVSGFADIKELNVTGFTTLTEFEANIGIVTGLEVTGILTAAELEVTDLTVTRNLDVQGITSLGSTDPVTGFTTVRGDLYVGGDLFVLDDIFYDEISGRNLLISGIATINELRYNVGFGTTANIGVASVGFLTAAQAYIGVLTVADFNSTGGDTQIGDDIVTRNLLVNGISSFIGLSSFGSGFISLGVGTVAGLDVSAGGILSAPTGFIDNLTVDELTVDFIDNEFQESGITTIQTLLQVDGSINAPGISTIGILSSTQITVSGVTSTQDLVVEDFADIEELLVNSDSTFNGEVGINSDVTIDGNLQTINGGNITIDGDLEVFGNISGEIGLGTITNLDASFVNIDQQLFVSGIATVDGNFISTGGTLFAEDAEIDTLRADDVTIGDVGITTLTVTGDAQFLGNIEAEVGVSTFGNLVVSAQLDVEGNLNATGISSIELLYVDDLFVDNLTYNIGVGTQLTVEEAIVTDLDMRAGIATIAYADIPELQVGIATVTIQLDYDDVVSKSASRSSTSTTAVLFTVPASYNSSEFTITAENATDIYSTKITSATKGGTVYWNEYATVFSNEIVSFNVVDNAGATELQGTALAGLTTFTVYVSAHR